MIEFQKDPNAAGPIPANTFPRAYPGAVACVSRVEGDVVPEVLTLPLADRSGLEFWIDQYSRPWGVDAAAKIVRDILDVADSSHRSVRFWVVIEPSVGPYIVSTAGDGRIITAVRSFDSVEYGPEGRARLDELEAVE